MDAVGIWFNQALLWILDTVQSIDPVARTLLAGLGMFLETSLFVGLVVPGDTIVLVASTAVDGPVEAILLAIVVIIGALGGQSVGFLLGRLIGPWLRRSWLGRRIGEAQWTRAANYVDRRGGIAVFISRFLPVLHSLMPVTVGMSTMTYRRFITWAIPATVLWTSAYVTVGSLTAGSFRERLDDLHWAGYVFVGVIAVFVIGTIIIKKLIARAEDKHMDAPGDGDAMTVEDPLFSDPATTNTTTNTPDEESPITDAR